MVGAEVRQLAVRDHALELPVGRVLRTTIFEAARCVAATLRLHAGAEQVAQRDHFTAIALVTAVGQALGARRLSETLGAGPGVVFAVVTQTHAVVEQRLAAVRVVDAPLDLVVPTARDQAALAVVRRLASFYRPLHGQRAHQRLVDFREPRFLDAEHGVAAAGAAQRERDRDCRA
jgi:hypothetical protein